ncbi:MAG: hypothetical protein P4L79_12910 [Legionella sp.]|uniref:hypothetical protein n=1 Tax=Legionella sp. TaxID=459 RepID=UPI00283AF732|nr:hypothetical protein [Legionella sp.]
MTFKLKTLKELKDHFNRTKDMVLDYEHAISFDKLEEPRMSSAMILLEAVLLKIEEQINVLAKDKEEKLLKLDEKLKIELEKTKLDGEKPKLSPTKIKEEAEKTKNKIESRFNENVQNYTLAFYGAMLIAQNEIHLIGRNRAKMLSSSIAQTIGIGASVSAEDHPNANNYEAFHVMFNALMQSHLFPNADARKGFKEEHMLSKLSKDDLERILTTGYLFEKSARITVVDGLATNGKGVIDITAYKVEKETPTSATERFQSFAELKKELDSIITAELVSKGKGTINEVEARATQLNFMEKICALVETLTIKDTEKTAIVVGAMYLVRKQIQKSYQDSLIHCMRSPDNSEIHKKFGGLLGAESVSHLDHESLLQAANNFIRYATLENKQTEQQNKQTEQKKPTEKVINESHPFAKIDGFKLPEVLNLFFEAIYSSRDSACKQIFINMKQSEKVEQPATSSTSYWNPASLIKGAYDKFGLLGGGKKVEAPDTAHTDSLPLDAPSTSLQ